MEWQVAASSNKVNKGDRNRQIRQSDQSITEHMQPQQRRHPGEAHTVGHKPGSDIALGPQAGADQQCGNHSMPKAGSTAFDCTSMRPSPTETAALSARPPKPQARFGGVVTEPALAISESRNTLVGSNVRFLSAQGPLWGDSLVTRARLQVADSRYG